MPIISVIIALKSTDGQIGTIVMKSLKKNVKTETLVSFVCDDGFSSIYNTVKPMFEARGIKFNAAINKYTIGTDNYVNLSQLQEIYANGHDILNHSLKHPDLSTKSYTQVVNEIQDMQTWLYNNEFKRGNDIFVYPSQWSQIAESVCKDLGISAARDIKGVNNSNNINNYRLRTVSTNNVTTLASLSPYVDKILTKGGLLIYTVYDVVTTSTTNLHTAIQVLQDLVDYVISKGIKIVKLSEWYDGQFNYHENKFLQDWKNDNT